MVIKKYIFIFGFVLLSIGCTSKTNEHNNNMAPQVAPTNKFADIFDELQKHTKAPSRYTMFTTFDEFKMCGKNVCGSKTKVKVGKTNNRIDVIISKDSTVTYIKYGEYWINRISCRMWKGNNPIIRDGKDKPATIHFRLLNNDHIFDLGISFCGKRIINDITVLDNKKNMIFIALLDNDVQDRYNPYPEFLALISKFKDNKKLFFEEENKIGYRIQRRDIAWYRLVRKGNNWLYEQQKEIKYQHNYKCSDECLPEEIFKIQPGLEHFESVM